MNATICVKSLVRPKLLDRLLQSLRPFPFPVLVADDSPARQMAMAAEVAERHGARFLPLAEDVGLSAGRNALLDAVTTPAFIMLDDDFVATPATDLPGMVAALDAGPFDLVGGTVLHFGTATHFEGFMEIRKQSLKLSPIKHPAAGLTPCDITYNFLAGRTEVIRAVRWHDELKLCEHQAFFLRCKDRGVRVAYMPSSHIDHRPESPPEYSQYRKVRSGEYYQVFLRLFGLTGVQGSLAV